MDNNKYFNSCAVQDWFSTRAATGSHSRAHQLRNATSKTAPRIALPASDRTQSLSSPSFGKAPLPEKAALGVEMGPAAPHGTWEKRPAVCRKSDREAQRTRRVPGRLAAKRCLLQAHLKFCAGLGCAPAVRSGGVAHTCQTSQLKTSLAGFSNIATR